jgi:hypothetical protein
MATSTAKAKTRTYYGEYTLKHWIDLILSKDIILPDYQRSFAWKEDKIKRFILSLHEREYVPPVIIAAGQENGKSVNLILDGQQRLTSILLAALKCVPNREKWKPESDIMEDDSPAEDDIQGDEQQDIRVSVVDWSFRELLDKEEYISKEALEAKLLNDPNYDKLALPKDIDMEELLVNRRLGFLYIVADDDFADSHRIFTKLFYSINYEGVTLSKVESRKALYYQDLTMTNFFEGCWEDKKEVLTGLYIATGAVGKERIDWLRYLSILSQKSLGQEPLTGYRKESSREDYYKDYVSYILGLDQQTRTGKFDGFKDKAPYKDGIWKTRYKKLHEQVEKLKNKMGRFASVIDADYWLFGLIFYVLFEGKELKDGVLDNLGEDIRKKIKEAKAKDNHRSRPNQLSYLRNRIDESIEIYREYVS